MNMNKGVKEYIIIYGDEIINLIPFMCEAIDVAYQKGYQDAKKEINNKLKHINQKVIQQHELLKTRNEDNRRG